MGKRSPDRWRSNRPASGSVALLVGLGMVVAASVLLPAAAVVWTLVSSHGPAAQTTELRPLSAESIGTTLFYCPLIALVATVLALAPGWALRRASAATTALVVAPLLMPSYLAYAGWGVLRWPGSTLGDWIGRGAPVWSNVTDHVLAVGGLALWAFPIAALPIGLAAARVPQGVLDALAMEPAGVVRRARMHVGLVWSGVVAGWVGVFLVMLGSAVPLQLAQIPTLAIQLWTYMSLTPEPVRAWVAAWPLVVVLAAGAWGVLWWVGTRQAVLDPTARGVERGGRAVGGASVVVWGMAAVVPVVLFACTMRSGYSLVVFWQQCGEAVWLSARTAGMVGAVLSGLALCAWGCRALEMGRVGRWVGWGLSLALVAAGLMPGVLVGGAVEAMLNWRWVPLRVVNSDLPVILAHVARFGFLGVLAGWWMAAQEGPEHRASRRMFAPGLKGWVMTSVLPGWAGVVGAGLAGAALSFHEIEATVTLSPAGVPTLAQRVLDLLHYAKDEQLAAAAINIIVLGTPLAFVGVWLVARAARRSDKVANGEKVK